MSTKHETIHRTPCAPLQFDTSAIVAAVFDTIPECIKVVARDGQLLKMNPAGLRMIDAERWESVEGASVFDLVAPEDLNSWRALHARVCRGESLTWEFDIIGLKGRRRRLETHAVPLQATDGSVAQLAITRDITAKRDADESLQRSHTELEQKVQERADELESARARLMESERGFELLIDGVSDYAIYMLDPEGRIVNWNSGAKRIKGYEGEEVIGKHFEIFYTEEDRRAQRPATGLRMAAQTGRYETEGWRLRKDGSRFWANAIIDAIHSNGQLVGFAKITRDITERRAAEEKLRHAQKMEAVGQFTGGAAHDFNNLLMAILGSLEILRKRLPDDPKSLSLLNNAVQGAKRGATLTQRMLAFARRQELKTETVELTALIHNAMDLMERSMGPAVGINLQLSRSAAHIHTDPNQLETVLLNLVINARDAMPSGGTITISVREETVSAFHRTGLGEGRYFCLSVADTGTGMDEATLARATEPFFTTKGVGKGTGLGLSMADGLAAQSGGKLMVHSVLGQGTMVEIWLPAVAAESAEEAGRELASFALESAPAGRLHVLAVDDDSLVLSNIAAMLEDLGHEVTMAPSGRKALELAAANPTFDLMISDQVMPAMTGLQLIEALRKTHPSLPVILATGYAEFPSTVHTSIGRLAKPYTQQELKAAVDAIMREPALRS